MNEFSRYIDLGENKQNEFDIRHQYTQSVKLNALQICHKKFRPNIDTGSI